MCRIETQPVVAVENLYPCMSLALAYEEAVNITGRYAPLTTECNHKMGKVLTNAFFPFQHLGGSGLHGSA